MPLHHVAKLNAKHDRLIRLLRDTVPRRIASGGERHLEESFHNQGFADASLVKWRPTKKGRPSRKLKASGTLMNSIRVVGARTLQRGSPQQRHHASAEHGHPRRLVFVQH
jgi:phage gpG-like protein